MSDQSKEAGLNWRENDVPVARAFDDPYYSLRDGAAETQHVFIEGNRLPQRLSDGFQVAELGFGTGLNLVVLLNEWRKLEKPGRIQFTSFEAFPIKPNDAARAMAAFRDYSEIAETVLTGFNRSPFSLQLPDLSAEVIEGDARQTVTMWKGVADAWFLDGFSPAKNPELWEADLMQAVFDKTASGGTVATYTAAGHVRQKLTDVGFEVERVPGFAHKRHMTIAHKP